MGRAIDQAFARPGGRDAGMQIRRHARAETGMTGMGPEREITSIAHPLRSGARYRLHEPQAARKLSRPGGAYRGYSLRSSCNSPIVGLLFVRFANGELLLALRDRFNH